VPDHRYVVTGDSVAPLLTAVAVAGSWVGFMFHPIGVVIGAAATCAALYFWFWQSGERKPAS
jgi:hypothetical protein